MTICQGLRLFLLSLSVSTCSVWAQTTTYLWPTVLFIKGQDLCQYEDAYASGRSAQVNEITSQLKELMRLGASTPEGLDALLSIDGLVDKNRNLATAGTRMDITLEASLKAYLDRMYMGFNPKDMRLQFFNPAPLNEVLKTLRENPRNGVISASSWRLCRGLCGAPTPTGQAARAIWWSPCTLKFMAATR
jgi:hypothetical protein